MFNTVKDFPQYLGRFLDSDQAVTYCNSYFPGYNSEHLHSGIDYVKPYQFHLGLWDKIVARRRAHLNN
jgi:putative transposase